MKSWHLCWVLALACLIPTRLPAEEAFTGAQPVVKPAHDLAGMLEAQERRTWNAFMNRDGQAFLDVVVPSAWRIDPAGFGFGTDALERMKDYELHHYTMDDVHVMSIDKDIAILGYTCRIDATYKGQAAPGGPWYCSTAYVRKGKSWFAHFHQESLAMPPAQLAQSK